ncbi:nicotinate phosphoribosyltransferase [Allofranklinella schreckenbergeri]|uniref:Nicotinate phosphoribosyltransferase n=1 Tax=Allofranklinella schreckenbergeri TaxID=1076744 RepID=A0A3M6R1L2_9BURK|nr:nicotinate phosphoribosyltransferase [Allofranklinella schreckenbergeri]RMX09168.1 nicotinate phosphoribosyltransferase [Allofranklinella schreckenbergeri]RRD39433.1 nicotinate phosphoribosyltransferase [Comamonadaceae bacterium OH3737_COT-264]
MAQPIITSLLDTDLYKFTMWQAMLHRHPQVQAEYRFVCRQKPEFALAGLIDAVNAELDHLCQLRFTEQELHYLGGLRFIKSDFIDFLRIFQFQRAFIQARVEGDALRIEAKGPQVHVMAFEIFVLAIVNELYFRQFDAQAALAEGQRRLSANVEELKTLGREAALRHPFELFDFGVRRRYSRAWQYHVVKTFAEETPQWFKGTSNVRLAMDLGIVPIGTMAHEYFQTYQALGVVQLRNFQKAAMESWVQEYRGDLGIALTDTVGMDAFLRDFDLYFAKLFDGLRHDSGDPIVWGEKALAHYAKLRIDPHAKRLVFSDGLTVPEALRIYHHFADRTQCGFGIGTQLTNNMGLQPLSIVMKLTRANGQPVAKISDTPGKLLCEDQTFLDYLRQVFQVGTPA